MVNNMKIIDWLLYAKIRLKKFITAHLEATLLLSYILKCSREYIICFEDKKLTIQEIYLLNSILKRRIKGEPLAYILKKKNFGLYQFRSLLPF